MLSSLLRVKPLSLVKSSAASILVPFDNTDALLLNVELLPVVHVLAGVNADRVLVVKPASPVCLTGGVFSVEVVPRKLAGVNAD